MSAQAPSSPAVQGTGPRIPTVQEAAFLVAIIKNSDGITNIDWDAVAREAGYNNGSTARTRFGQVKRSLGWTVRCVTGKCSPTKNPSPTKVTKAKSATPRVRKPKALTKKQEEAMYQEALPDEVEKAENCEEEDEQVFKAEEMDEDEYASADDLA